MGFSYTSMQPKPGFGIRNLNQGPILVSEPEPFFFPKTKLFFSNFSHFFPLLGGMQVFISLKINPDLQKESKKYLMFGGKFGFRGPFYDGKKIPHAISNYILPIKCGYGIGSSN